MALSKWYLCGSEGNFDKNEVRIFAHLPSLLSFTISLHLIFPSGSSLTISHWTGSRRHFRRESRCSSTSFG
jgi:hypothetical protein